MNPEERKTMRVAGCFLEYDGKFLILQRHPDKPQGNTWGLPAGKVDGDDDKKAVLREIQEETGYVAEESELEFLDELLFEFPDYDVEFPTFRIQLKRSLEVEHRSDEHITFKWVTGKECYAMQDLIYGFHELLEKTGYVE